PTEATAIGNVMMQAKADNLVGTIQEMRSLIRASVQTMTFMPKDTVLWDEAYQKYLKAFREDI
ncbi:MAG: rhamnulokinase, partial [Phocaeicola sp.]|nr:rhamnulokinase [Phocaeicola sp.]